MPHLGERFGHLDAEPVQVEVFLVLVLREQLARALAHASAHRDQVERDDIHLAGVDAAEEVGDVQAPVALLTREREPDPFRLRVLVVDDQIVALRLSVEVAIDDRRLQDLLGDRRRKQLTEDRLGVLVQPRFVLFLGLLLLALELPLATVERDLVEVLRDLRDLDRLHDPAAVERRRRDRHVGRDVRAGRLLGLLYRRRRLAHALLLRRGLDGRAAALLGHERVHRVQAFERVASVEDLAVVDRAQIPFDIASREGCSAEDHRPVRQVTAVQFLQVLAHHDGRLHEQPGQADRIDLLALGRLDDRGDRLLDAEVEHRVAVVRQDDVDEVLADVVHVALHRRKDHLALASALDFLHVRLEVRDRCLHRLRGLQHERQLHLARREQLADDLHPFQQVVVDDVERCVRL